MTEIKEEIKNKIESEREEKNSFFKTHPQSPIPFEDRNNFNTLNYYPIKQEFRFILKLHEHKDKKRIEVNDNKGNKQEFLCWGEFRFEIDNKQVILQAYKSNPNEERLWIPFRDETNKDETYGAGRYIDLEPTQHKKGDRWILDLNLTYNPFCAYNENYVCPFIPSENWLSVKIEAGEKKYKVINMTKEIKIEKKLKECEEKLKEMERLKLVEHSVIAGLREEGFSEKAIKLFRYRENFLITNPMEYEADTVGSFTGSCGDRVGIYLKIGEDIINDAKYTTNGCPGAVTSSSALTSQLIGKTIDEAKKLNINSVIEYLKENQKSLPKHMYDCCGIAVESLKDAINKYKSIRKESI